MSYTIIGLISFVFFFLYDINSVFLNKKFLKPSFMAGCVLLCLASTGLFLSVETQNSTWLLYNILSCLLAAIFFVLLIYTLFFAIPFKKTYMEDNGKKQVCDFGVYALCRHPGVLWLFLVYLFAGIGINSLKIIVSGFLFSLCNIAYVVFQDKVVFPEQFQGYDVYKKNTPFLFPDSKSIRKALKDILSKKGETK